MEINQETTLPHDEDLESEWIDLIFTAREMEITIEEIRFFLANATKICAELKKVE